MNILDQHINETSRELLNLWGNLDKFIASIFKQHQTNQTIDATLVSKKFFKIRQDYNRFYKLLIYKLATYNLFGLHLRKIIAYLNISNEMFQILHYYKSFLNFLLQPKLDTKRQKIINNLWSQLIQDELQIKTLFVSKDQQQVLNFLKTNQTSNDLMTVYVSLIQKDQSLFAKSSAIFLQQSLVIFEQIRGLQRIGDHFNNILENYLLILDFAEFKRYRNEKITA